MSDPANYTVGWICALDTEFVAAQELLDEEHDGPAYVAPSDNNVYTLGAIGQHNVVIAVLPAGQYGLSSATGVVKDMLTTFRNLKIGLMVGIGGGAPTVNHDIRLGDIVVSTPYNGDSGVIQYDYGKAIQEQTFLMTSHLNKPPQLLLAAVSAIKAAHKRKGHQLDKTVCDILSRNPRLQRDFARPDPSTDLLYRRKVVHPKGNTSPCSDVCGYGPSKLHVRAERGEYEDDPKVHYGLIASANTLMKDAVTRDRLAADKNVLCFEMEAAGLMNQFPCIVIRGICDYADSHKNEGWQGYAAIVAAAYAKELLNRIAPDKVEGEQTIAGILAVLEKKTLQHLEVVKEQCEISREQLDISRKHLHKKLSQEEANCHQVFRLASSRGDATYEWYKDRVDVRVEGTCHWFLEHHHFQTWMKETFGPLLVSADPGCGKSVLAKHLIDNILPGKATVCYYFFKEGDQNTVRQALCSVLHQLFRQIPSLIEHAMGPFRQDGPNLSNSTSSLWQILRAAVKDPKAGPVIIVLDALDECNGADFESIIRNVEEQFNCDGRSSEVGNLRYLLTSRPYDRIVNKFHNMLESFPKIRIPGEEANQVIGKEIDLVINHRIDRLSRQISLSLTMKNELEKSLQQTTNRTYLWVYLIFDYLENCNLKRTAQSVALAINTLPKSVNDAYEEILSKVGDYSAAQKILSAMLAAERPLTIDEANIIMNLDDKVKTIHGIDLEERSDFTRRLVQLCGLFVSVYQERIYFLHQTAREFLVDKSASLAVASPTAKWHRSISMNDAHAVLASSCILYLEFFNADIIDTDIVQDDGCDDYALLNYAASHWAKHFKEAGFTAESAISFKTRAICCDDSKSFAIWSGVYQRARWNYFGWPSTGLVTACDCGLEVTAKLLIAGGADVNEEDDGGRTPLLQAAKRGHEAVVRLLLNAGAKIDLKHREFGLTPLLWAAENGHEAVVRLLLNAGAQIESKDSDDARTSLSWAAENGHEAVVKILLDVGAEVDPRSRRMGYTPLSFAALNGHQAVVKRLLDAGAEMNSKDRVLRYTPLLLAADNGHEEVVRLLLNAGAQIISSNGQKSLSWAAKNGHETLAKTLLNAGAVD